MFTLTTIWQRACFYGALVALAVGLGAGACWYLVADTIAALRAQVTTLSQDLKRAAESRMVDKQVSQTRAVVRVKRAGEAASATAKTEAALAKAPEWADAPVPPEVRDALR